MKRRLTALLTALLLAILVATPALAATATASTLRLEQTEGTVAVTGKSGKAVSVSSGMKLYNGYGLATEIKSYAYISLDSAKAVKLDAVSKAEVRQEGKKLEVDLKSGNLFFNVTAPLAQDESLNIRTSTMVTGIRGTAGFVQVIDQRVAQLYLLSGQVTLASTDPISGEFRTATVTAGQMATSYVHGEGQVGDPVEIVISGFAEEDVPGFVAQEIKKDAALQQAITNETELSVPKIIGEADGRLAKDEAGQAQAQRKLEQAQSQLDNDQSVDPLYTEDTDDTPMDTTPSSSKTLYGALTVPEVQAALDAYITVFLDATANLSIVGETLTIPAGKTLSNNGVINLENGGQLVNHSVSTLNNTGSILPQSGSAGDIINGDGTAPGRANLGGSVTANILSSNPSSILNITGDVTGTVEVTGGSIHIASTGSVLGILSIIDANVTIAGSVVSIVYLGLDAGNTASISGTVEGPITVYRGTIRLDGGSLINTGGDPPIYVGNGLLIINSGLVQSLSGAAAIAVGPTGNLVIEGGALAGSPAVNNSAGGTATYNGGLLMGAVAGTLVGYTPPTPTVRIDVYLGEGVAAFLGDTPEDAKAYKATVSDVTMGDAIDRVLRGAGSIPALFDLTSAADQTTGQMTLGAPVTIAAKQDVTFFSRQFDTNDGFASPRIFVDSTITNNGTLTLVSDGNRMSGGWNLYDYNTSYEDSGGGFVNNGTLNLTNRNGRATPSWDQPLELHNMPIENSGVINLSGLVAFTSMDGIIPTVTNSGQINLNGAMLLLRGPGFTLEPGSAATGNLHIGAGSTLCIGYDGPCLVTMGCTLSTAGDGAWLYLLDGSLVNATGQSSCIVGSVSLDCLVWSAKHFTFTGEPGFAAAVANHYSTAGANTVLLETDTLTACTSLPEAMAILAAGGYNQFSAHIGLLADADLAATLDMRTENELDLLLVLNGYTLRIAATEEAGILCNNLSFYGNLFHNPHLSGTLEVTGRLPAIKACIETNKNYLQILDCMVRAQVETVVAGIVPSPSAEGLANGFYFIEFPDS